MDKSTAVCVTIDQYISQFPAEVQARLTELRQAIREAAPGAEEKISYRMPAFFQGGRVLVYFAAYKKHIGFYPTADGIEAFQADFGGWKSSKGAVQFPLDQALPLALVQRIVKYRLGSSKG